MGLIPDFVLDYISVSTFWTILFTFHALLAVALLGGITHQTAAACWPAKGAGSFVSSFRAVSGPRYTIANIVLAKPVNQLTVTYCDGASHNNLSAKVLVFEYVGSIPGASGQTLAAPTGTVMAKVSDQPLGVGLHGGEVSLVNSPGPVGEMAFGGEETFISQICIE